MSEQAIYKCKSCGANLDEGGRRGKVKCPYCGTVNYLEKKASSENEIICPACGTANKKEFEHCVECGQSLYQDCPKCKTRNAADAVFCSKCGLNLEKAFFLQRKYFEYCSEAYRVSRIYTRTYRSFVFAGFAGILISMILIMTTNFTSAGITPGNILILLLLLSSYGIILLGSIQAQKKTKTEAQKVKTNLTGFDEFYKLYANRNRITHYWSREMATGEKLEKFLSISKLHNESGLR